MSLDKAKMVFGLGLLTILALLALAFGLGEVKEQSSFGLMPIITTLSTLAGGFAQWAFGRPYQDPPSPSKPEAAAPQKPPPSPPG